ncbi:hypothetical protein A2125_02705 [Candidatus Woesebacteria bacterium GWB1_43_5]|uniref:Uncharacterized protein n=1 Tax=Candidatus Woesebacteria bacterium GWB1_43_5 TaxID=1802474 RepID=A0A1F7WS23_9BACT|nr:MAG: hypothetical protein A2125_02705 [Candidatus Woesebacteria bacterium GWB1_43_5]
MGKENIYRIASGVAGLMLGVAGKGAIDRITGQNVDQQARELLSPTSQTTALTVTETSSASPTGTPTETPTPMVDAAGTGVAGTLAAQAVGTEIDQTVQAINGATQATDETSIAPTETATHAPSATETIPPLPTMTSSATRTETATSVSSATETTPPTPTMTSTVVYDLGSWEGEFTDNNMLENLDGPGVLTEVKRILVEELREYKQHPNRGNSTLTSLVNRLARGVSADPLEEPGLGQIEEDIEGIDFAGDIFADEGEIDVDGLAHTNEEGVYTMAIFGPAHERDYMLAVLAVANHYYLNPEDYVVTNGDGSTRVLTLAEVFDDPGFWGQIAANQDGFLAEIQEQSLGVSEVEQERRRTSTPDDISASLPEALQIPDQYVSCDVFRPNDESLSRNQQLQSTRRVVHTAVGGMTFGDADSETENLLYVLAIGEEVQDMDAFTFRSYEDPDSLDSNQIKAVVGEEERPCGEGQKTLPTPTLPAGGAAAGEAGTQQPVPGASRTPITEETPVTRATPGASATAQNPEATPTAGGIHGGTPTQPATVTNTPAQNPASTFTPLPGASSTPFGQ